MADEYKKIELINSKTDSSDITQDLYSEIYSSYFYDALEKEAQEHIKNVVDSFLQNGEIGEDAFLDAAPTLFKLQPSVGEKKSARKEVLRIGEELLNDAIFDDILLEESESKRQYYLNEHYFILYHYLSRYWAVRERADVVLSQDTELAVCYRNICLSVEVIYALKGNTQKEAEDFINNTLKPLKPKIANRYGYFLDKEEEEQDSDYTIKLLRRANAIRLCWLWDRLVIEQYISTAHALLLPITIIAGYVSFGLYLFLASIHISGALGAYFEARANEARLKIDARKVLLANLKLRKDVIINDLIWGLANLACVFWLCGFGLYANIGDLLTGLLLVMDLGMSIWSYKDEKKEYASDIRGYNSQLGSLIDRITENFSTNFPKENLSNIYDLCVEIKRLIYTNNYSSVNAKLKLLKFEIAKVENQDEKNRLEIIYWQLKAVHDKKESRYNAWQDKHLSLYSNIFYAAVLVIAFSAFCGFYLSFFPVTLPMSIALLGGMMLAASTIAWRSANSYIECRGIDRNKNKAKEDYEDLLKDFINNHKSLSKNQQMQLCLRILQKGAQVAHQEEKLLYKKLETLRETANRLLIPGAIVLNFLFLPASVIGVPTYVFLLLGIGIAAVALSMYIKKHYAPKGTKWLVGVDEDGKNIKRRAPSVSENEFTAFKSLVLESDGQIEDKSEKLLEFIKSSRTGNKKISFSKGGIFSIQSGNQKDDDNLDNTPLLSAHRKES